jgi:hypothetical protein
MSRIRVWIVNWLLTRDPLARQVTYCISMPVCGDECQGSEGPGTPQVWAPRHTARLQPDGDPAHRIPDTGYRIPRGVYLDFWWGTAQ